MTKSKFSFEGWNLKEFLKGRKRLIVTLVGTVVTYVSTNNPALSAMVGAASELLFAVLDYWLKE